MFETAQVEPGNSFTFALQCPDISTNSETGGRLRRLHLSDHKLIEYVIGQLTYGTLDFNRFLLDILAGITIYYRTRHNRPTRKVGKSGAITG